MSKMRPKRQHKKCLKCGACCRNLIIEIEAEDIEREPEILNYRVRFTADPLLDERPEEMGCLLVCGETWTCPFHKRDQTCGTYATRPDVCRYFRPGSKQCKMARSWDVERAKERKRT